MSYTPLKNTRIILVDMLRLRVQIDSKIKENEDYIFTRRRHCGDTEPVKKIAEQTGQLKILSQALSKLHAGGLYCGEHNIKRGTDITKLY